MQSAKQMVGLWAEQLADYSVGSLVGTMVGWKEMYLAFLSKSKLVEPKAGWWIARSDER
jgi:hypothetical protein